MRLYVINLERSADRLIHLQQQFAQFELDFTRIEAVDFHALSAAQCENVQSRNIWTQSLAGGEIACFLSHVRALERFIADNLSYGVIFEDDVTLGYGAADMLSKIDWLERFPKTDSRFLDKKRGKNNKLEQLANRTGEMIDIVKLETSGKKVWLGQGLPLEGQGRAGFSLAQLKSPHILSAAYLISRDAAIHLLDLMRIKAAPFDHFLFNFSLGIAQEFALYQLDPAIAVQAKLASTLAADRAKGSERAKTSRRLNQTLARETCRLIQRTRTGLWGIKTNLFTTDQWKRVPFSNDI